MPARKILLTPVTAIIGAVLLISLGYLFWLRLVGPSVRSKIGQTNIILRLSGSNTRERVWHPRWQKVSQAAGSSLLRRTSGLPGDDHPENYWQINNGGMHDAAGQNFRGGSGQFCYMIKEEDARQKRTTQINRASVID